MLRLTAEVNLGWFSRKADAGMVIETKGPRMDGWKVECGPKCGFNLRDHDKAEAIEMAMLHMTNSHGKKVTKKDAEAALVPTSWGG